MPRALFAFIMLTHGLIHLIGFFQAWHLAALQGFSGKTLFPIPESAQKIAGVLWLVACVGFLAACVLYLTRKDFGWMLVASAVLSQLLIVLYWQDAKFGTFANMIMIVAAVFAYAATGFDKQVNHEIQVLLADAPKSAALVDDAKIRALPQVVQKWLEHAQVRGKKEIVLARLSQRGDIRTKPEGKWMPVEAEQYVTTTKPGFLWNATIHAGFGVDIVGRDQYKDGHGNMLIKLMSLITLADDKSKEIDQSTLLRYLAEMAWYPTGALQNYVHWEAIDAQSAKATMRYQGVTASGIYHFNVEGDVVSFEGERYYTHGKNTSLEPWFVKQWDYQTFEGIRIPTRAEVTWKLKDGDFMWYKLHLVDVHYNETK